jgi:hypothetical protein
LGSIIIEQELIDLSVSLIRKHFPIINKVELKYLIVIMTLVLTFDSKRPAESVIYTTSNPIDNIMKFEYLQYQTAKKFEQRLSNIDNKTIEIANT